jgi:hypothetical protein
METEPKRPRPDDGRNGCAKPALPGWRRLGERVRQAALAATALHLIEAEKGSGGSVRETMVETSRKKSGG